MTPHVSRISVAPVKALGLQHPTEVTLHEHGATENRLFYLVDDGGRVVNQTRHGSLVQVSAEYDADAETLTLRFPDGTVVSGEVALGEAVETVFARRPLRGRLVAGPWNEPLSAHARTRLRIVRSDRPGTAVDRSRGGVSLVSDASLNELARAAGQDDAVDGRRFRMLFGLGGCAAHEEDGWLGRDVRIGDARVRLLGTVGRCVITTRNPDTGIRDLDTLAAIKAYRGQNAETKELDFGVYGEVVAPGRVRVGDPVEPIAV